jgi:predicted transposase/invertase (TIGR01784 family)
MERNNKTLQELTIADDFMFGAVMQDPENCRLLLERILGMSIAHVDVIREKSITYHPEYKGVRLDVVAKDGNNTRFDVEMQVRKTPIGKRSRYYHSQMDMEILLAGTDYDKLPNSYVIFICDYDPFGKGRYRYTFNTKCIEDPGVDIDDGVHTIILSNRGTNCDDISEELLSFLQYSRKSLAESREESQDAFIQRIQKSVCQVKASREMGELYMKLQLLLKEERQEGREEGRILGTIETMYDEGKSKEQITDRVVKKYGIEQERAEKLYSQFLQEETQ